jgi:eukaryotic-like serine/threonine-protein kinase
VLATPVMPAEETMPMAPAAAGYQQTQVMGPQTRQQMPARVGDPRKRKSSSWVIATFAALGVLAVIALAAALLLNQREAAQVRVPTLEGKTQAVAFQEVRNAGLVPVPGESVQGSDCKKGTVAGQTPPPNTTVNKGDEVIIQLCGGPKMVRIPPALEGSQFANVKQQLEGLELKVNSKEVDSSLAEGLVVSVRPKEGETVPVGSTVEVQVSKGNVAKVPDVVGLPEDQAERMLKNAGYRVRKLNGDEVTDPNQVGKVSNQTPDANKEHPKGRTVTIYVDRLLPEPTETPTSPEPTATATTPGGGGGGGLPLPTYPPARLGEQ